MSMADDLNHSYNDRMSLHDSHTLAVTPRRTLTLPAAKLQILDTKTTHLHHNTRSAGG